MNRVITSPWTLVILLAAAIAAGATFWLLAYARHPGTVVTPPSGGVRVASADGNDDDASRTIRLVSNPKPAPAVTVQGIDGGSIASHEWHGKVTLLNFWATWCAPCIQEVPDLVALQNRYPDTLQIIGFSVDEGPADQVRRFIEEKQINYPVAIVGADISAAFGGVVALPTTFVIDPEGRVMQKHVGILDPAMAELEVRALAGLPVDAVVETFDDTGEVWLANAAYATELPGLDLSALTADEKRAALERLNTDSCTCGCGLTLAQCRINDPACSVSLPLARQLVDELVTGGL